MRRRQLRDPVTWDALGTDVVLYGATGYTGKLIAAELDASGVSYGIAGRDAKKLAALRAALPGRPPAEAVGAKDAEGLRRVFRGAKVVVSAAGPYTDLGPPVLAAAIDAGAHWVDVTGEQTFLRHAFTHDARAKAAGLTVVNAMGFDVVPSDIAAFVSVTGMKSVKSLDIAIESRAGRSAGTLRSMARMGGKGWWFDDRRFRPAPPGRFMRTFDWPDEGGEKSAIFVPWGDVVTAPRSTRARTVRTFFVASPRVTRRLHRVWPLTALLAPTGLIERRIARAARNAPEGPPESERAATRFAILAEAEDDDGVMQRGYVTGRDPYGFTGAAAAHAASILAKHSAPRGVLTPTQVFPFGPLTEALSRFDLKWRARSVD